MLPYRIVDIRSFPPDGKFDGVEKSPDMRLHSVVVILLRERERPKQNLQQLLRSLQK